MTHDTISHDKFSRSYVWKLKCTDPRTALPARDPEFIGLGWGPIIGISDRLPREWEFLKDTGASLSLNHCASSPCLLLLIFHV